MTRDRHIDKEAKVALEHIVIPLPTAVSQTDAVAFSYTPGYAFKVERVRSYCRVKAGTITAQPKVGGRACTAAAAAFTTATEVNAALHGTLANLKGSASEAISVEYTSDGSGALTNGCLVVTIRPQGMRGD
jgi:hypothetical protein